MNEDVMKAKKREYMRPYMRRQRSAAKVAELLGEGKEVEAEAERQRFERQEKSMDFKMEEAEDLRVIVEEAIGDVRKAQGLDPIVKARCIFQGAETALKLLKLTDLAKKVKELQADRDEDE